MKFTKMHGLGNDYIYVDCFQETLINPNAVSEAISRYHFGIGSDGLILICPSEVADCRMRMFNADGSEGIMCGNGIRCVGKYVYDHDIAKKPEITVETLDGIKTLQVTAEDGKAAALRVDMGPARPGTLEDIHVNGEDHKVFPVDMGNPHAVYIVENIADVKLEQIGPSYENHPRFQPHRVNSEFVQILSDSHVRMRVWERGSGITLACGTGACATAVACCAQGLTGRDVDITMDGGTLHVEWNAEDGHVYMTGPATEVFTGEIDVTPWDK